MTRPLWLILPVSVALVTVVGCSQHRPPDVLCTTTIIGDAAERIAAGTPLRVETLMGPGTDPHQHRPSPADLTKLGEAKLVLFNGLHLEGKMTEHLEHAPGGRAVAVTKDIPSNKLRAAEIDGGEHDPHVWFDVALWKTCVGTVRDALCDKFPEHAETFRTNADAYLKELDALHAEVREKAMSLKPDQRVLVTSHDAFGYFADAYGFKVYGLQGVSTGAESGTARVSELATLIAEKKVPALFTETSVPERGLKQVLDAVKQDHGRDVKLVAGDDRLFSDSLGEPNTPGGTYAGMVRHNIDVMVRNLK